MLPARILLMLVIVIAVGFCARPKEKCTFEIREGKRVEVCRIRYTNGKVCEILKVQERTMTCKVERIKTPDGKSSRRT
ncbi:unnamed protein product [Cylicocyclus nassatus]|uniref:Uncharacterized protein n=1 Tax=Cylicocyclus nassatus TaxID=53992 RepID=A0AA36DNS1_CYLNA|nr:unnamed protein product [Cylicocyclus nassatus]